MSNKILALFSPRMRANLAPEIQGVWISESGEMLYTTTDEESIPFSLPYFPSVTEYSLPLRQPEVPIVFRSKLTVVKRIAHGIDKVSYIGPSSGKSKVAIFKFPFM